MTEADCSLGESILLFGPQLTHGRVRGDNRTFSTSPFCKLGSHAQGVRTKFVPFFSIPTTPDLCPDLSGSLQTASGNHSNSHQTPGPSAPPTASGTRSLIGSAGQPMAGKAGYLPRGQWPQARSGAGRWSERVGLGGTAPACFRLRCGRRRTGAVGRTRSKGSGSAGRECGARFSERG